MTVISKWNFGDVPLLRRRIVSFATLLCLLAAGTAKADPPVASNVSIDGTLKVGETLTGRYNYSDPEGDAEGDSLYQWIRYPTFGNRCFGFFASVVGNNLDYQLTTNDLGACFAFRVTPVARQDSDPFENAVVGVAVTSPVSDAVGPANTPPQITGQDDLSTNENEPLTLTLDDFSVQDPDNDPRDFTLIVEGGADYSVSGTTITPSQGFSGELRVGVRVSDGEDTGDVFNAVVDVIEVNEPPVINGQNPLSTDEDTPLTLSPADFDISDPDGDDDFSLIVGNGDNYSVSGTTITPARDFSGTLQVPVRANDGGSNSAPFNASVVIEPVNDAPRITGQSPITIEEDDSGTLRIENFTIEDPDSPAGSFSLTVEAGENYSANGTTITPEPDFFGELSVPVVISDGQSSGNLFNARVVVTNTNDQPTLLVPLGDANAVENAPFDADVSGNFVDIDGDMLTYEVAWPGGQPPNIAFDGETGRFSGTPLLADTEAPGPVYDVTITARDPDGESVSDSFVLTISALDRANLALEIDVTPDTGEPGDEFMWTFSSTNPVGPQDGDTVELTGTFTGTDISVVAESSADCTITPGADRTTSFNCMIGALPVGSTASVTLRTTINAVTEVLVSAMTAGASPVPIDPNLEDNTDRKAIGVGDAFSGGAAEIVGNSEVIALATGDLDGDGRTDIAVGTSSGQPVQVFLADEPRESCACYRDFVDVPLSVPTTGRSTGIALADFDGNGTLDLVVATEAGQADEVFSNDGAGNFTLTATLGSTFARAVATGDFNGDANPDIVVATAAGNPVYLGDGAGGFTLETLLGAENSYDVAVARLDDDGLDDVVFANDGASQAWRRLAGGGFASVGAFQLGRTSSVAAGDLNGDGRADLVFGRLSSGNSAPSNPVYYNKGNARFGSIADALTISPTLDVALGDINRDGAPDVVFVNQSGVHQVWLRSGDGFSLAPEQIIDLGAQAVAIGDFGEIAESETGGNDIVLGGAASAGIGIYLNDGAGNLGLGDTVAPDLVLVGESTISVPAAGTFDEPGVVATDNIDGDISPSVVVTSNLNPTVVGTYSVTYNVSDLAGNSAPPVSRTVVVEPAAGTGGGGGGGTSSPILLAMLSILLAWALYSRKFSVFCRLKGAVNRTEDL